jgi:hypothetical protein
MFGKASFFRPLLQHESVGFLFPRIAAVAEVTRKVPDFLSSMIGIKTFATLNRPRSAILPPPFKFFKHVSSFCCISQNRKVTT